MLRSMNNGAGMASGRASRRCDWERRGLGRTRRSPDSVPSGSNCTRVQGAARAVGYRRHAKPARRPAGAGRAVRESGHLATGP